jgi:DNA repair protein SbcD/Mre11
VSRAGLFRGAPPSRGASIVAANWWREARTPPCEGVARRYNTPVRFLHTSDWHVGRSFYGVPLLEDQAQALDQLVRLAVEAKVDAVLVAGDVYDRSAPPADAVSLLDDTLTRLVAGHGIPVVAIAGNHDSGERLDFGSRLLSARGLHVAGTAPLFVPFEDEFGPIDVVAVPFAEPGAVAARRGDEAVTDHESALRADLAGPGTPAAPDAPASTRPRASRAKAKAAPRRRIAVAHAFVAGGSTSESERPLVMGNAALVPAACFEGFAYAALGHLHRPQMIGRAEVRYSGSLLKYSFDEAGHRKSVSLVEIGAGGACTIEEVRLAPRRDVRVLEGTFEEIRDAAAADASRDDYVLARLTDRAAVIDAMVRLREHWPNCLHVTAAAGRAARGEDAARVHVRSHGPAELFDAFFRDVTGDELTADERAAFAVALDAAGRAAGAS